MVQTTEFPSFQSLFSGTASLIATAFFLRSVARDFVPYEIQQLIWSKLFSIFSSFSSQITITIDELEGLQENTLYQAADVYLGAKLSPHSQSFRAFIPAKETNIVLSMNKNQEVVDVFNGVPFKWRKIHKQEKESNSRTYDHDSGRSTTVTISYFKLSFHRKHRDMVFDAYLPYIVSQAAKFKDEKKTLKIHTLKHDESYGSSRRHPWTAVNLDHPATFETMAMETEMKEMIMEDLERFVKRKEFYRRVGKAWKRGYLLFGPPGTGKSSLIAAMANYLKFDIYDLELTDVKRNSELRKILIATANRSILVVEDIDCTVDLERKKKPKEEHPQFGKEEKKVITLSGFLNFIDGLWSSCGDERIIIFTTNHKERLDPALLRPGRMDVHIHLSYCSPCGFKMLASNYWGITDHPLFMEVEHLMPEAQVTPAEVAEQLLKTEHPDTALTGLLEFLKIRKIQNDLKARLLERESENREIIKESDEDGSNRESTSKDVEVNGI